MTAPAYGVLRRVSETASVLLENNPSTMTLEGTNTWVLRGGDAAAAVVVDPGYHDLEHLEKLAAVGPVELILLTHHHPDHAEGAPWFASKTGAPVRAFDPSLCIDAPPSPMVTSLRRAAWTSPSCTPPATPTIRCRCWPGVKS